MIFIREKISRRMCALSMWKRTAAAAGLRVNCSCRGIAGELLRFMCNDMREKGIDTLYLITDHTSFYERYGWEYLCMVEEDEGGMTRMYIHNGKE